MTISLYHNYQYLGHIMQQQKAYLLPASARTRILQDYGTLASVSLIYDRQMPKDVPFIMVYCQRASL